jgi:hypothetical protein
VVYSLTASANCLVSRVHRLGAHSHFPIIEVPDELTAAIERFLA